jgi:hypothetical protein
VGRKSGGHDVVVLLDAHAHVDKDNNGRRQQEAHSFPFHGRYQTPPTAIQNEEFHIQRAKKNSLSPYSNCI